MNLQHFYDGGAEAAGQNQLVSHAADRLSATAFKAQHTLRETGSGLADLIQSINVI